jgi:integrase
MRIYKPKYRSRDGTQKYAKKFYVEFTDHLGVVHRLPAFADRRLSEALGRNIEALVNCRIAGLEPDIKLNQWLETVPDSLLRKFVSWGLVDGQRTEATKPLSEHVADYTEVLKARGRSRDYVVRTKNRLRRILQDCRFVYFRDVTRSAVERYSARLRDEDFSDTSRGHYLSALQGFLAWAESDGRILASPLKSLEKPKRDSERKGILEPEQFMQLVKVTFEKNLVLDDNKCCMVDAQSRVALYLLAATSGLRRKELLNIVWRDVNLDEAFVRVRSKIAKNSREATQPLPEATVAVLRALKNQQKAKKTDRVFVTISKHANTNNLLQQDLKTARVPLVDKDGNAITFHSLRNSYISYLASANVPAKTVQKLARHADPRLTFNVYARTLDGAEQQAVNCLPNFDPTGLFCLGAALAGIGAQQRTNTNNCEQGNQVYGHENAIQGRQLLAPRGFEPLLPG